MSNKQKWYDRPMSNGQQILLSLGVIAVLSVVLMVMIGVFLHQLEQDPVADHFWQERGKYIQENCEMVEVNVVTKTMTYKCENSNIVIPINTVIKFEDKQ